jgi:hypothetical protein
MRSKPSILVIAVLAVGAVLRCIGLGHRELWHDEYCSLLYATAPEGTLRALRAGGNPPLYFLLLRAWMGAFGTGETAVRALSVVFSTAAIGSLGLWLRSLELPRRAVLWAMTLAAVTPLHLFYAREGRSYAVVLFLIGLGAWTFTEALRCGSGGWWAFHGAVCLAGFYTHNLLVPLIAVFWIVAWRWGADRRAWTLMLAAHAGALALYAPWIATLAGQAGSGQERWILPFWRSYPPALAIPRSLLAFGVGGPIPTYIAWPSPDTRIAWLSGGFFAVVALFALLKREDRQEGRRAVAVLVIFLLLPLIGLWFVSVLYKPIYIVGRYDIVALPAFLGLMGIGIDALQKLNFGTRTRWAFTPSTVIPVIVLPVLVVGALLPRYTLDARPDARPNRERADLLARFVAPGDLLVAHDLAASNVLFLTRERKIDARLATFPPEILAHWGWFNADESLARGRETLLNEAASMLEAQRREHPGSRVWLLPHLKVLSRPGAPHRDNPHQELLDLFLTAAHNENLALSYPDGADPGTFQRVGIVPLAFR